MRFRHRFLRMKEENQHFPQITIIWHKIRHFHTTKSIGSATKSFRFFPLDDFNRSKSFFSIANFWPYMIFDSWRFIDYSLRKKFQVMLFIYFFALVWNGDSRRSFLFHFITSEKVKMQCKLGKRCMMFMAKNHEHNASARIGFLVFVPETLTPKMHHALDAQL